MTGHTPGKWVARPDPDGSKDDGCVGLDDSCSPIDYIATCHWRNARLIAAAPNMLDALQDALAAAECADRFPGYVIERIRAAIARATGESA